MIESGEVPSFNQALSAGEGVVIPLDGFENNDGENLLLSYFVRYAVGQGKEVVILPDKQTAMEYDEQRPGLNNKQFHEGNINNKA